MKVLFIGHYREGGGWAEASIGLIRALESAKCDVVCRSIDLVGGRFGERESIKHLEEKSLQDIDYCIQHSIVHRAMHTTDEGRDLYAC